MSIDTRPYQEALRIEVPSYTDWDTLSLRNHIKELLWEKEVSNSRKADELERQIGHACFELSVRNRDREVESC